MSLAEQYPVGSVVWYECDPRQFPWWPCEVVSPLEVGGEEKEGEITLKSFQDNVVYSEDNPSKLKSFQCDEARDLVIQGKKKLKRKKTTYDLYCNAIQDAFELIQGRDENFVPEFNAFADVSILSNMSQLSEATPERQNSLLALNDSSIFTPNTHSKTNHWKTISTSGKKSFERHSTPVRPDFCSIPEDTPSSDLLCKAVEIRKNGGRKRTKRNGEEIGSESKKRKLSAEGRKSAGRKSAGRKSAGRPKKQSSVDRGMNGDADHTLEEDPVTKRLDFDTDHDSSVRSDILQVLHPSQKTKSPPADSDKVPSMDVAMSSVSDTSKEHSGPRPSQEKSTSDGATTKTTCGKKPKRRTKKEGKSSKCTKDSSEDGAVRKNKSKENKSSSGVTDDQDTGALLPPGSLCEGDMTTREVTPVTVREERKEEKNGKSSKCTEDSSEDGAVRKNKSKENKSSSGVTDDQDTGALLPPGSLCEGDMTTREVTPVTVREERKEEENEEQEKEKKEEKEEKKERHFRYDSDSEMSFVGDTSELESSESASEDDLPAINMEVDESVRVSQLQPNDIIWVKFKTFPHWPAIVSSVSTGSKKQEHKSRASILFFGYDESNIPIPVKERKNIARFGTKKTEEFMEKGRACNLQDKFLMAVEEARRLIQARADGAVKGTPKEQLKEVAKWRPKTYKPVDTPMALALEKLKEVDASDSPPPASSAFGFDIGSGQRRFFEKEDSDASSEEESEEEQEEDPKYNFEAILGYFKELKPVLTQIVQGSLPSDYHKWFVAGSRNEQAKLKVAHKYGPLQKWPDKKRVKLVEYLAQVAREASNNRFKFSYAHDVLLPEAMTRTIAKFEGISLQEANNQL